MDIIDANIDRLRSEIARCESQLQSLKEQLNVAESDKTRATEANGVVPGLIFSKSDNYIDGIRAYAKSRWPLSHAEYKRYGRQLIMPEVGLKGQLCLRSSRVLVVGAGGLGCPAAAYLAGAGVGTLGLADGDTVEVSNLHRQILHSTSKVGTKKVESAIANLRDLNSDVMYVAHDEHIRAETAPEIFEDYDIVLDCTDNPASRYLISDACVIAGKPLVSASALKTDGQLMIFNYPTRPAGDTEGGPCYRCMFPKPPPPESVVTCGEGGILGPVVGVMGVLQALEAIKIITGYRNGSTVNSVSEPPQALLFSGYAATPFRSFKLCRRRKTCAACSSQATVTRESLTSGSLDYIQFCGALQPISVLNPEDRMSPKDFARHIVPQFKDSRGYLIIDTREKVQYDLAHIAGISNLPFSVLTRLHQIGPTSLQDLEEYDQEVQSTFKQLKQEPEAEVFTICRLGNDSQLAIPMLKALLQHENGGGRFKDIRGGLRAWRQEVDPYFPDI